MPYTKGFRSAGALADHFNRHRGEFPGLQAEVEYVARADAFLGGPVAQGAFECTRSDGDTVRYNPATGEFGIMTPQGVIRSYFIAKNGDAVRGLAYFHQVCAQ